MTLTGFEFPRDDSGQWDGFNEPGIEHFSGNPFEHLGREVTQNTLDARRGKTDPAKLIIRRTDIPTKDIPDVEALKEVIGLCAKAANEEGPKAKDFFDKAEKQIQEAKTSVLQFSDVNTTGVPGPCENGRPFFALMKATGQSKKETGTATGSFGIGKFAPFTVSGLRTVFLSTAFTDTQGAVSHYVQGKSILMSHDDAHGHRRRGTGFWGVKKGCMPVVDGEASLPQWLQRPGKDGQIEIGTTLSVLGFRHVKGWPSILGASIAESFFGAICSGHLEVEIENGATLASSTLATFFADETVKAAIAEQDGEPDRFTNSAHFLKALSSAEAIVENHQNQHLGHCRLHILVGEGLPKRVAILRNGMLITDELRGLKRFSDFKEFVAVVECLSDPGNELLRAMEPPAHDDFQYARLPVERQTAGRVALGDLAKWVREKLRQHAQDPVADVTAIDELADFFGDEEDGANGAKSKEENPLGKLNIRARPLKRKAASSSPPAGSGTLYADDPDEPGDDGDAGDDGLGGEGAGGTEGGGGGTNDSDGGSASSGGGIGGQSKTVGSMSLKNVRAVILGEAKRRIAFTADATGLLRVELEDSGADTNRLLRCTSTSLGAIEDGRITGVPATVGARVVLDVQLEREFAGTIRVRANAV